ncbi:hypothetical protein [Streptomyces rubradiris]|nr:hypothetical protein [Streptomyces rubradiris]GHH31434.1 hypothetical protein GCM10018792_79170 [Streptomyces rubradiris]
MPRTEHRQTLQSLHLPSTAATIRAAVRPHQEALAAELAADRYARPLTAEETAEEEKMIARIEAGEGAPEVFVRCFSDRGTGWTKTAIITAGIRIDDYLFEAAKPVHFGPVYARATEKPHETIKRYIWRVNQAKSMLVVASDVPVIWYDDPRP